MSTTEAVELILLVLLVASELLPFFPRIKGNGVIHQLVAVLKVAAMLRRR